MSAVCIYILSLGVNSMLWFRRESQGIKFYVIVVSVSCKFASHLVLVRSQGIISQLSYCKSMPRIIAIL